MQGKHPTCCTISLARPGLFLCNLIFLIGEAKDRTQDLTHTWLVFYTELFPAPLLDFNPKGKGTSEGLQVGHKAQIHRGSLQLPREESLPGGTSAEQQPSKTGAPVTAGGQKDSAFDRHLGSWGTG